MKNLENVKELDELEEKEVSGGRFSPGETISTPYDPNYLQPKPDDDPNIKLDNIGGPGPGGITYTW